MRLTLLITVICLAATVYAEPAKSIQILSGDTTDNATFDSETLAQLTLTQINITGIDNSKQLNNAEIFLTLEKLKNEVITQPAYVNYLIDNGVEEIKRSQQPFGYYDMTVKVTREIDQGKLTVNYHVELGEPTKIRTVSIAVSGQAEKDPEFQKILAENPFHEGEVLSQEEYETYKGRFLALAVARGYFDGQFSVKVIKVHPKQHHADIQLHYDSGERYHFNQVVFARSTLDADGKADPKVAKEPIPLDEDLLQRFVQFQSGQPYSVKEITQLQSDLQGSGYFRQVLVGGNPNHDTHEVPVEVQLTMNHNKSYTFGLGYATDTGMRGKFDFDWRWVNQRGHTFSSNLYLSQKESRFDNMYRIPAHNPTNDYYYLRFGGWMKRDDYKTRQTFLEGGYNWRKNHWEYRLSATTAWETFHIGNDNDTIWLTYPTLQATYSSTQNRLNPKSGFQVRTNLKGGVKHIGSEINFAQTNLNIRLIQSLDNKNRVLARFDGGANWTDDFHRLPPSLRYFSGGDRSIRGYAYDSIGPRDSSGDNIGGKYLAVGSLEYEYYVKPDWALATFIDAGDAFSHKFKPMIGAGAGLHWQSPVGPIKIDLGHGFNKKYGDNIRLHLSIGAELDL